jgi:thioesterase domain-containing protein
LKEQVKKRQREMFLEVVQENTDIDDVTKAHIVHLLDDLRLINNTYVEKQTRISEAAVALNNQIRADFPIKSRCWKWFNTVSTKLQP